MCNSFKGLKIIKKIYKRINVTYSAKNEIVVTIDSKKNVLLSNII